ncbi:hypothetical protein SAMN04487905_12020 [Actinopolyspora xinjiangensis]|uniref:Uncharacterized protein n=1 Tax=Actinopolyspora xinjiangensis TaxID=405564 RepID=A0A1H0X0A4_9ACTN|nr:hypothetical protein [Actinopolyspora xinjiangensis]SDP96383.1 hypothetical protein SAMN04487905_12020 [Actinopolyspora xinjiangensis]
MGFDMVVQGAPRQHSHRYLRRGVFGMLVTAQEMVRLGMAFTSDMPTFPESGHLSEEEFTNQGEPVTEQARTYLAQLDETLSAHGGDGAGIPLHKFGSNDGWHVTAVECADAVAAYDRARTAGTPHPNELEGDVVPFLRTAAQCDGFRVY